ncbi:MAG: thioredoxin family protein [Thermofilaceae archaeon]
MPIEYGDDLVKELHDAFKTLINPVKLLFFTNSQEGCKHCDDIREILDLLAKVSDKIKVEEYTSESEEASRLEVPMYPALIVHGAEQYNIRFFGTPAGYEFASLIEDIQDVSRGEPRNLSPRLKEVLRKYVTMKTRIKVFVTPSCPYCPLAVRAAHRFAMVNRLIYGDMIEALEFSDLADKYGVYAVPKIIIEVEGEDRVQFEGAAPDVHFISYILKANGVEPSGL